MADEKKVTKTAAGRRPWWRLSLTGWILVGLVLGGLLGYLRPDWGNAVFFLRDIFLNLIKSIIAPLVFSTLVVGIAGGGDLKKVGRMGAKALIYFEVVTSAALFIGLAVVNLTRPGVGVQLAADTGAIQTIQQTQRQTFPGTLEHIFPASIADALVRGDALQIGAFSIIFAMALSPLRDQGN